jgi:uncharacterized membrane protein YqjE
MEIETFVIPFRSNEREDKKKLLELLFLDGMALKFLGLALKISLKSVLHLLQKNC